MKIRVQKSIKRTIATIFTVTVVAAAANTASASNRHSYNGSYCKAYFGTNAGDFSHGQSGIFNQSNSTRLVTCPVLVDEVANRTGTNGVWLHWQANAAFPNHTLRCTLWSRNGNGAPRRATAGSRTGSGWFSIANVDNDDFWGSYTITCNLPRGATLNTIWVDERN